LLEEVLNLECKIGARRKHGALFDENYYKQISTRTVLRKTKSAKSAKSVVEKWRKWPQKAGWKDLEEYATITNYVVFII